MKKHGVWLILGGLFLLEGTILEWLLPAAWQTELYVTPHLVLIVILYLSLFVNRHYGLVAGLVLGFLQDVIYYGHALGVYSFAMGLSAYAVGLWLRRSPQQLFVAMQLIGVGIVLYDLLLFGIHRFFLRVTAVDFEWMLTHQLLPSLFVNMLFALVAYVPMRNLFERMSAFVQQDEN